MTLPLQSHGDKTYVLPIEELQQMQRGLLDINNLLTAAYKELLEENEALKKRLGEARSRCERRT